MNPKISDNVERILACPNCGESLNIQMQNATCKSCRTSYEYTNSGVLDFRLRQPKKVTCDFILEKPLPISPNAKFFVLQKNRAPEVDYSTFIVPSHLSNEILSYFPRAKTDQSLMLDIGCGNTIHRKVCEYAGFEYVGLDYESDQASILGDAHALPFKAESFEFILSIAVLEHIRFPFVMMKEVYRVLKTYGMFIGTVAFLEPFHAKSFYHHTHLGILNLLSESGFQIDYICPSATWSVLSAQAEMSLFPHMPHLITKCLVTPLYLAHRIWWKVGGVINKKASEEIRIRNTTGSFTFIARKTSD